MRIIMSVTIQFAYTNEKHTHQIPFLEYGTKSFKLTRNGKIDPNLVEDLKIEDSDQYITSISDLNTITTYNFSIDQIALIEKILEFENNKKIINNLITRNQNPCTDIFCAYINDNNHWKNQFNQAGMSWNYHANAFTQFSNSDCYISENGTLQRVMLAGTTGNNPFYRGLYKQEGRANKNFTLLLDLEGLTHQPPSGQMFGYTINLNVFKNKINSSEYFEVIFKKYF